MSVEEVVLLVMIGAISVVILGTVVGIFLMTRRRW